MARFNDVVEAISTDIATGRYYTGSQPMFPDGTLDWDTFMVPGREGLLLLPPDYRRDVMARLVRLALLPPLFPNVFRMGGFASVRRMGDVALRVFDVNNASNHAGLLPLQANLALNVGFARNQARIDNDRLLAPVQLGAFLRPGARDPSIWAMTFEEGKHPPRNAWFTTNKPARISAYSAALRACGVLASAVHADDKPDNMFIRPSADPTATLDIVKLDLFVRDDVSTLERPRGY